MIYKIVFDTNVLRGNENEQINTTSISTIEHIDKFCRENKIQQVELSCPELVNSELLIFKKRQIETAFAKATDALSRLRQAGHKELVLDGVDSIKIAREIVDKLITKYALQTIPIPILDPIHLVERALAKTSPYKKDAESDPGFKDTIIFLSIKEDAKKYKKGDVAYIFVGGDRGFTQDVCTELRADTGQELYFAKDHIEVKDLLDDKLTMGLKLSEKRETLDRVVASHQEPLRTYLNNKYIEDKNSRYNFGYDSTITGYNFSSFRIVDFQEVSKNKFDVSCSITADLSYQKPASSVTGTRFSAPPGNWLEPGVTNHEYQNVVVAEALDAVFSMNYVTGGVGLAGGAGFGRLGENYKWKRKTAEFPIALEVDVISGIVRVKTV